MNNHFVVACTSCRKLVDECECPPASSGSQFVTCTCTGCEVSSDAVITPTAQELVDLTNRIEAIKVEVRKAQLVPLLPLTALNLLNAALAK